MKVPDNVADQISTTNIAIMEKKDIINASSWR